VFLISPKLKLPLSLQLILKIIDLLNQWRLVNLVLLCISINFDWRLMNLNLQMPSLCFWMTEPKANVLHISLTIINNDSFIVKWLDGGDESFDFDFLFAYLERHLCLSVMDNSFVVYSCYNFRFLGALVWASSWWPLHICKRNVNFIL